MLLPFITTLLSAWYIWSGHPRAAIGWWLVTLAIYLAWFTYHWTTKLHLSF
ncbi:MULTISPECIES: DUF5993 family protein [Microbulbifer]|uniref:DUF5993 family protein n=1 Tax=Microbulbifer TaxID=48073 RepID=UPI001FDF026E|nr:DUF5993 family protein [Microbulbifer variabilis]